MKIFTEVVYVWDGTKYVIHSSKEEPYTGPVAMCCGASSQQKQMYAKQSSFFDTLIEQAKEVFGGASTVFKDLVDTFAPIVKAGPNQHGFNLETRTALNTQATEGTSRAFEHASKAVNESIAARGGGNAYIPSGADEQLRQQLAAEAAANESEQKLKIVQADYDVGRDNYFRAASGLAGATNVFAPAVSMSNAATEAGNAASNTANEIAQANNSWVNAAFGALGGVGSAAVGGLTSRRNGCWIAAACFDGWDDVRTILVRDWLWSEFIKHWYGRLIMSVYMLIGERVSKVPILVKMLKPLFYMALRKAEKVKTNE